MSLALAAREWFEVTELIFDLSISCLSVMRKAREKMKMTMMKRRS